MTELPIQRLLLEVLKVIDRLGIPYMIIGGFAVRTWGVPRPTYDADLAVAADTPLLKNLLETLEGAGFDVPVEHERGFVDTVSGMGKLKVTRFEERAVWDIDLFLVRGAFLESALSRRRSRTLEGRSIFVAAPEDLVLMKLVAYRRKDQLDAEEILRLSGDLDLEYLRRWARHLEVLPRLEDFLREIPPR